MQEYRLYVFDSGRLLWPTEFQSSDDETAVEIAEQEWMDGRQMELWTHGRKVRSWGFSERPSAPGSPENFS